METKKPYPFLRQKFISKIESSPDPPPKILFGTNKEVLFFEDIPASKIRPASPKRYFQTNHKGILKRNVSKKRKSSKNIPKRRGKTENSILDLKHL